jgi:hypothetical protein
MLSFAPSLRWRCGTPYSPGSLPKASTDYPDSKDYTDLTLRVLVSQIVGPQMTQITQKTLGGDQAAAPPLLIGLLSAKSASSADKNKFSAMMLERTVSV